MKKILIPLVFILASTAIILIILNEHIYREKQAPMTPVLPTEDVTLSGYVTLVDTSEMAFDGPARIAFLTMSGEIQSVAVPSMGLPLCAARDMLASPDDILVGDMIEVRGMLTEEGIVPCASETHYLRVIQEVVAPAVGLRFAYRTVPSGYTLQEFTSELSVDPDFVRGYMLTNTAELEAMASSEGPREGPPVMQIRVYRNEANATALDWARSHPLESNIELAFGEPKTVMVEHVPAVLFRADGLYASDVYVAAHGDFMYVFTGAFMTETDAVVVDFAALMQSVVFLENETTPIVPVVGTSSVILSFGETGEVGGLRVTPQSLLEDSRCPSDVVCVQAGTTRITAVLESGLGTAADTEFELGVPITTEAEIVTLTAVAPEIASGDSLNVGEYRFTFSVAQR